MMNGKMSLNHVILSLGGNQGNVIQTFTKTKQIIEEKIGSITKTSSLYQTAAWGVTNQPDFFNQVIGIETTLAPTDILNACMEIEKHMGRTRTTENKWMERSIDIDILFYNEAIIRLPYLEVPHPQITHRKFILIPLMEIIPNFIHPVLNKTIKNIAKNCKDTLEVNKIY